MSAQKFKHSGMGCHSYDAAQRSQTFVTVIAFKKLLAFQLYPFAGGVLGQIKVSSREAN